MVDEMKARVRIRFGRDMGATGAFLILLCFFLLPLSTFAQLYPFDFYTAKNGLLSDYVLALCCDSRGYLWIGTDEGLGRYDGDKFQNYTVADGLALSRVTCLTESRKEPGTLWIGTNGGGVSKLVDGKFRNYRVGRSRASNLVSAVCEDSAGTLWCGTVDGVYRLVGDQFLPFFPIIYSGTVNGLEYSADGFLWVVLPDKVYMIPPRSDVPVQVEIRQNRNTTINCVHAAKDSTVLIGLSDGTVVQLRGSRITRRIHVKSAGVAFILDDSNGFLAAAANGIYRIDRETGQSFPYCSTSNGLLENYITAGAIDREGDLWLGFGSKGVAKLANRSIVTLPLKGLRFAPNASSGVVDRNNHLWIVSSDGAWELWMSLGGSWTGKLHTELKRKVHERPFTLLSDPPSKLWVGYDEGVIACYEIVAGNNVSSSLRTALLWRRGREFPHGSPLFLYKDREGFIWSSMDDNRGVYLFDPRRAHPFVRGYAADKDIPDNSVRALLEDAAGNFWFGGYDNGLTLMRAENKFAGGGRRFTVADGLPNMSIRSIKQDTSGIIWFGTRYGGLAYYSDSVFHSLSLKEGLASTAVWSMTIAHDGRYWVGTQLGFQEIKTQNPFSFSSMKELLGRPVYACGEINDGWLWMVTDAGVTFYDRSLDRPNISPPPIYLSQVLVNGIEVDLHRPLEFAYDQNSLTVDVVGLSFKDENAIRYQYKLLGNDTGWSQPTDHHSIVFAALAPGSYTFMAQAINGSGIASAQPAGFSFAIAPPLWRRWWFVSACVLIVALVVFVMVRIRFLRLLEIERIRAHIATDLHDDIGAGLTRIAILSSVAERELPAKEETGTGKLQTGEYFKKIGDTARELVDSMSDVVWSLELSSEPLEKLVFRFRSFAFEACEAKDIALQFFVNEEIFRLHFSPENARNILLCAKEAITNVVKHSECSEATVEFGCQGDWLILTVKDNGYGIQPTKEGGGHGLSNMRKRSANAGGICSISSSPETGTQIHATFPSNR